MGRRIVPAPDALVPALTSRRGFTLIELTVAVVLAGAVVAIAYGAVAFVSDQHESTSTRADEVARHAAARRQLARWLAGARVLPQGEGPAFQGVDGAAEAGDDDQVSFLLSGSTSVDRRYTVVRLYVDRDPGSTEQGLVAELRSWRGEGRESIVVEPGVRTLDARYLVGRGDERRWLRSWISSSLLPRAVELRFGGHPDSVPELYRIPLTVALSESR